MDPITCAARRFLDELNAVWEAKPSGGRRARVVRAAVAQPDQGELVKALRLAEASPENRRPLFLIEEPFADSDVYFARVCDRVAEDYEALRQGAAEEGVELSPLFMESRHRGAFARAMSSIEQAARMLGERLDGAVVAFVPERVDDAARWQWRMAAVVDAELSSRAHIVMADRADGPLAGLTDAPNVKFVIDRGELAGYMRKLLIGAQPRRVHGGPPVLDGHPTLALQLLNAADQMNQGDAAGAAATYQQAIAGCKSSEQVGVESCAWIGLAAANVALGNSPAARSSYLMAADAAERAGLPALKELALRMTGIQAASVA